MSNDDFQHQDFWTKVVILLNEEQESNPPKNKTWVQIQEEKFLKQLKENMKILNQ